MPDIQHSSITSADAHEPKHITSSSTADAGKVITPSSTVSGTSQLRQLKLTDLDVVSTYADPISGWQFYEDTPNSQTIVGGVRTQITIDGVGAATDDTYEPSGAAALWNVATSKIAPENVGDAYCIRLVFSINYSAGANLYYDIDLDIGGGSGIILQETVSVPKGTGVDIPAVVSWPIYVDATFLSNGGTIYITPSNNCAVTDKSILITKTHRAA